MKSLIMFLVVCILFLDFKGLKNVISAIIQTIPHVFSWMWNICDFVEPFFDIKNGIFILIISAVLCALCSGGLYLTKREKGKIKSTVSFIFDFIDNIKTYISIKKHR